MAKLRPTVVASVRRVLIAVKGVREVRVSQTRCTVSLDRAINNERRRLHVLNTAQILLHWNVPEHGGNLKLFVESCVHRLTVPHVGVFSFSARIVGRGDVVATAMFSLCIGHLVRIGGTFYREASVSAKFGEFGMSALVLFETSATYFLSSVTAFFFS